MRDAGCGMRAVTVNSHPASRIPIEFRQPLSHLPHLRLQLRVRVLPQVYEPVVVVARAGRVASLLVQLAEAPIGRSQRGALLERAEVARRGDGALVHGYA